MEGLSTGDFSPLFPELEGIVDDYGDQEPPNFKGGQVESVEPVLMSVGEHSSSGAAGGTAGETKSLMLSERKISFPKLSADPVLTQAGLLASPEPPLHLDSEVWEVALQNTPAYRHSHEGGNPPRTEDPLLRGDDDGMFLPAASLTAQNVPANSGQTILPADETVTEKTENVILLAGANTLSLESPAQPLRVEAQQNLPSSNSDSPSTSISQTASGNFSVAAILIPDARGKLQSATNIYSPAGDDKERKKHKAVDFRDQSRIQAQAYRDKRRATIARMESSLPENLRDSLKAISQKKKEFSESACIEIALKYLNKYHCDHPLVRKYTPEVLVDHIINKKKFIPAPNELIDFKKLQKKIRNVIHSKASKLASSAYFSLLKEEYDKVKASGGESSMQAKP